MKSLFCPFSCNQCLLHNLLFKGPFQCLKYSITLVLILGEKYQLIQYALEFLLDLFERPRGILETLFAAFKGLYGIQKRIQTLDRSVQSPDVFAGGSDIALVFFKGFGKFGCDFHQDNDACGGTHSLHTGIGVFLVLLRVEQICGTKQNNENKNGSDKQKRKEYQYRKRRIQQGKRGVCLIVTTRICRLCQQPQTPLNTNSMPQRAWKNRKINLETLVNSSLLLYWTLAEFSLRCDLRWAVSIPERRGNDKIYSIKFWDEA